MSDISLNGYVQKRRGVLTHLQQRRMTANEYLVFDILLMLADKQTGSGWINAAAIGYWTGGQIKVDAADRALRGLEKKDYIVREITPGNTGLYQFHVQKFVVTYGAEVGKVLTFRKRANKIEKTEELLKEFAAVPAEDSAEVTAGEAAGVAQGETAGEGADNTIREKREEKKEKGESSVAVNDEGSAPRQAEVRPEAGSQKPEKTVAEKLANRFWHKIGKLSKYNTPETFKAWSERIGTLLSPNAANYDTIAEVIDWALEESPFWTERIVGATQIGCMEFFVRNYETIEQQRLGAKKASENAKKKAQQAAGASNKPNSPYHSGSHDFMGEALKRQKAEEHAAKAKESK